MNRKIAEIIALGTFALVIVLGAWVRTEAQDAKEPYLKMAPLYQYLMADRDAEIALGAECGPGVHHSNFVPF